MKRGEAKIEFYSNLNFIKIKYDEGIVVSKILYNLVKNEKNIIMSYQQFNKYFNETFNITLQNQENKKISNLQDKEKISKDPIKININTKGSKIFKPNKKFNHNDIL